MEPGSESCNLCGSTHVFKASGGLCAECRSTHVCFQCTGCGATVTAPKSHARGPCGDCNAREALLTLSASALAELDAMVLANEKLPGIKFVRETLASSLGDAVVYYGVRYAQLREEGAVFPVEHDEYWKGFYS